MLVVGCGDVGLRVARDLGPRVRRLALTSSPERKPALRAAGLTPLSGNLDDPASLRRLAGLATRVVHLAPPPGEGHAVITLCTSQAKGDREVQRVVDALFTDVCGVPAGR